MTYHLRILHVALIRFWSAIAWNALSQAEALRRRGHQVWVAGVEGSPLAREVQTRQAHSREAAAQAVHVLETEVFERRPNGTEAAPQAVPSLITLPYIRPWTWPTVVARLRSTLVTHAIDVAYVHTGSGHLETHLARAGLGTAIVRIRADARRPRGNRPQRWLHRHGAERVLVTGAYMLDDHLHGWGLPPQHAVHVPPGIDVEAIATNPAYDRATTRRKLAEHHGISTEEVWLGIVGRLSPVKGHAALLRAAAELAHEGRRFRLWVVGAEKQVSVQHLRSFAADLGIGDRMVVTGFVDDALAYAAALDVGIVCSLGSEAVSRSALEFMALGVPVVATRVGALPEIVGDARQLAVPGDPAALARVLARLIDNADLRARAGEEGFDRVRHRFSLAKLGERCERAGREALALRRGTLL